MDTVRDDASAATTNRPGLLAALSTAWSKRFDLLLVDRYLTAFENGALDEATCGHRVLRPTLRRDASPDAA